MTRNIKDAPCSQNYGYAHLPDADAGYPLPHLEIRLGRDVLVYLGSYLYAEMPSLASLIPKFGHSFPLGDKAFASPLA